MHRVCLAFYWDSQIVLNSFIYVTAISREAVLFNTYYFSEIEKAEIHLSSICLDGSVAQQRIGRNRRQQRLVMLLAEVLRVEASAKKSFTLDHQTT